MGCTVIAACSRGFEYPQQYPYKRGDYPAGRSHAQKKNSTPARPIASPVISTPRPEFVRPV